MFVWSEDISLTARAHEGADSVSALLGAWSLLLTLVNIRAQLGVLGVDLVARVTTTFIANLLLNTNVSTQLGLQALVNICEQRQDQLLKMKDFCFSMFCCNYCMDNITCCIIHQQTLWCLGHFNSQAAKCSISHKVFNAIVDLMYM